MLPIAGQTVLPNGLKFFFGHSRVAGGCFRLKKFKKIPRATPDPLASTVIIVFNDREVKIMRQNCIAIEEVEFILTFS